MKRCAYCDERLIFDSRMVGRNGKMIPLNRIDGREHSWLSERNPINSAKIRRKGKNKLSNLCEGEEGQVLLN